MLKWEGGETRPNYVHYDTTSISKKQNYQALNREKKLEENTLNFLTAVASACQNCEWFKFSLI